MDAWCWTVGAIEMNNKHIVELMHVYAIAVIALVVLNVAAYLLADEIVSIPMVDETISHHHPDDVPVLDKDLL